MLNRLPFALMVMCLVIAGGCGGSGGPAQAPEGLAPVTAEETAAKEAYEKEYAAKDPKDR